MATQRTMQISVVTMSTIAFTVCFAVWMMFAVIGIPIKKMLDLNETQFGLLAAMPVLTGSLIRLPLGMWTDKVGGRIVFFVLMLCTVPPIWLIGEATAYWHFLVLGLFVGLAGGSFSVGIAYCARWFDKKHQGFAMGIFGAGNSGAALNKFVAPVIVVGLGWAMVPKVYAAAMLVTALAFWFFTYTDPAHVGGEKVTVKDQLKALRDPNVWKLCQYYSIVFGGYVALSLWMTKYYITEYGFGIEVAALLAACFSLPGGVLRAAGGWMSDRWGAHPVTWWVMLISWGCLFFLSYPADRPRHQDRDRRAEAACRAQPLGIHRADVPHGDLLGVRQGVGLQVHLRRVQRQHRRDLGDRRPRRRAGRLSAADHVRRAGGPYRCQQLDLHVDVGRDAGVAGVDVLDRDRSATRAHRRPGSLTWQER